MERELIMRENHSLKKRRTFYIIFFVILLVYSLCLLFPYAFAVNSSLRENGADFSRNMTKLAFPPCFQNYIKSFSALNIGDSSFFSMIVNSVWYSVGGSFAALAVVTMSSYVVAKYSFKGKNFIFNVVIFMMIFPVVGAGPATYRLYSQLGFVQSPTIILGMTGGLMNLVVYSYFKAVPWEYAEAAFIDGASHWKVFLKIMVPMALPALAVLFMNNMVALWNDYGTPILYLNESFPTLASGMYVYEQKGKYDSNRPVFFAGSVMATLVPVILFAFMQNLVMSNVSIGGLKG